jgi:hypothetical protein
VSRLETVSLLEAGEALHALFKGDAGPDGELGALLLARACAGLMKLTG